MKAKGGEQAVEQKLIHEISGRSHLHNKMQGEAGSADVETASYIGNQASVVSKGGSTKQQILYVGRTALCWKEICYLGYSQLDKRTNAWLQRVKGQAYSIV